MENKIQDKTFIPFFVLRDKSIHGGAKFLFGVELKHIFYINIIIQFLKKMEENKLLIFVQIAIMNFIIILNPYSN